MGTSLKYSVLITAYKEPNTIGKAIDSFAVQMDPRISELIVVCPDEETTEVVLQRAEIYPFVRHVQDPKLGKPAALNIGMKEIRGEMVFLSDGDVWVGEDSLAPMLKILEDPKVGAVTAQPISISPRTTMLGFWSHLLTHAIHEMRQTRDKEGRFLILSGYYFAYKPALIDKIPEDALSEDAVISHMLFDQDYQVRYCQQAEVYVKYPTTYKDWLIQKVRSAGGYAQDYIRKSKHNMRSPLSEAIHGTSLALKFPKTLKESAWTYMLFIARVHLWSLVFINVRVMKRPLSTLWKRVETTK